MEIVDVIGKWMEAGELRNFIKVWILVSASLCFCYYVSRIVPKGSSRLLVILPIIPVICLNLILPLSLHTLHLGISTAFFLCWLGNFKLLMFAFGKGPLSDSSLSVSSFIALACLPIKFKPKSSDHESAIQLLQGTKSIWNYAVKLLVLILLLGGYERYYGDQHPWAHWLIQVIYCCHLYVAMEIILAVVGGLAGSILGIEIEPPFNEPYLSSSLQDFWGRRWNIMVTRVLHPSVYEPVLNISTRVTGRKWAPLPAMLSTFAVSAIMHELLFYYMGRKWPTWKLSCFFLLHGVCLVIEVAIKKTIGGPRRRRGLPRVVAAPLTVVFVMITSYWLFFPELLRHNAMDRAFEEYAVMGAFVEDVARALEFTF